MMVNPSATDVLMSRHNFEAHPYWTPALKQDDQVLFIESYEVHRDNKKLLKYSEVKELIDNPKKIKSKLPKGFVKTDADVYELLALFIRYHTQAKHYITKQDAV